MYTGTLINELIATADRVGQMLQHKRVEEELHEIFSMQIPVTDERAFMGAA